MACYIVDQAKEVHEDTHSASASESEESEGHSEDELSDVIPFQDKRKATALDYSSESDSGQSRRDNKENRGHSSSTTSAKVARKKKRKRARAQSPCDRDILSELKKINQLMQNLSKKMKRHDTRLQAIENKLQESTMSSNSSVTPKRPVKKEVPCEVRVSNSNCTRGITCYLPCLRLSPEIHIRVLLCVCSFLFVGLW